MNVDNSTGKARTVLSDKLEDRPEDLSFFKFLCNVDPKAIDNRILQEQLSISFSLKLPLSIYVTTTQSIVESIGKRSGKNDRSGATGLSKLVGATGDNAAFGSVQKDLLKDNAEDNDEGDAVGTSEDGKDVNGRDDEDGGPYRLPTRVKKNLG